MCVSLDSQSWSIYKRYSEFKRLHDAIAERFGLSTFAVPKLLLHTPPALKQREVLLQQFLADAIAKARAARTACPPLEKFLGLQFSRVRSDSVRL